MTALLADLPGTIGPAWAQPIEVIAALLIAIGVIVKVPGLIWHRVLVPASNSINRVDTVGKAAESLAELATATPDLLELAKLAPSIKQIATEMTPNGGSSLKDSITRVETVVGEVQVDMTHVKKEQGLQARTLKAQAQTLKRLESGAAQAKKTATRRSGEDG